MKGYSSFNSTPFGRTVEIYASDVQASFNYASSHDYNIIIRSYAGLAEAITIAYKFPLIKLVMPAGSNENILIYSGEVSTSPIIITGAGVNHNVTGYKIEFFSIDPITTSNL